MSVLFSGTLIPMPIGEGTWRAVTRWLDLLHIADVPRARALFTHHPDYADLTPVQYAEGLAWLRGRGLVDHRDRPVVRLSTGTHPDGAAALNISRVKWNEGDDAARRTLGMAGEEAVLELLKRGGARRITHVAAISDSYGFDIDAESWDGVTAHLEVKATMDPTRLVIHLTRHEYEVMCGDGDWLLVAVLVGGRGTALAVATVDRAWLRNAAPMDRGRDGSWESVRYSVPGDALVPGLMKGDGRRVVPESVTPFMPLWGVPVLRSEMSV